MGILTNEQIQKIRGKRITTRKTSRISAKHKDIETLLLENAGQQFKMGDFLNLQKPGVYVLIENNVVTYVGYGNSLLHRVGNARHHRADLFLSADVIKLFPCISDEAAQELESILIERLNPTGNIRKRYHRIVKNLGYSSTKGLRQYGVQIEGERNNGTSIHQ